MLKSIDIKGGFIFIVIFAFIVTLVSILTPAWKVSNTNNQEWNQKIGLVTTDCVGNDQQAQMYQECQQVTDNRKSYEKWTLALLIISAIFQIIAVIIAFVTLKSGTKIFLNALINVIIALIIYASKINNQQNSNQSYQPRQPPPPQNYQNSGMNENYNLGYSFSLSIVSGIFLVTAVILGTIAACMSESGGYPRDIRVIQNHRVKTRMVA